MSLRTPPGYLPAALPIAVLALGFACGHGAGAQRPFACDNTRYQTIEVGGDMWLYRVDVDPVGLTPLVNLTARGAGSTINSSALNPVDGYLYAADVYPPFNLYRVDADYNVVNLGAIWGDLTFQYLLAGAISLDGRYVVRSVTSSRYYEVDLATRESTLLCDFSSLPDHGIVGDIAFNPTDGKLYGLRDTRRDLLVFDPCTCDRETRPLSGLTTDGFGAIWIDASGLAYAYQNSTGGLFAVDLATGATQQLGTGGTTSQTDGCSCAGVDLLKSVSRDTLAKGFSYRYVFEFFNATGDTLRGARLTDVLPAEVSWITDPMEQSDGLTWTRIPGTYQQLTLDLPTVPPGRSSFELAFYVDPAFLPLVLSTQATLSNLPAGLGSSIPSDDPRTAAVDDPTAAYFVEHCGNGVDDDGDGLVDGADDDCSLECYSFSDSGNILTAIGDDFRSEYALGFQPTSSIEAIEYDPLTGQLYGADASRWVVPTPADTFRTIGKFAPGTDSLDGAEGRHQVSDVDGLARDPVNDLWYGAERRNDGVSCTDGDVLFVIDQTTGRFVDDAFPDQDGDGDREDYLVLTLPAGLECYSYADDLGFDPYNGRLYGVFNGSSGEGYDDRTFMFEIDPETGVCANLGELFYDDGGGADPLIDVEGLTYTLDGRVLVTTGDSQDNEPAQRNSLFELAGIGGGGAITATKLQTFFGSDYEAITCLTYADPATVSGKVYNDRDRDGAEGAGDVAVVGAPVLIVNATTGDTLATKYTEAAGGFAFMGLPPASYRVVVSDAMRASGARWEGWVQSEDPDGSLDHRTATGYTLPGSVLADLVFGYHGLRENDCADGIDDDGDGVTDCDDEDCPPPVPVTRVMRN